MGTVHDAARAGDAAKVLSLLAQGQKVDARDKHSRTALHMAAWAGQANVVEALLASKANKGATAMDDMNALHFAAQKGQIETSEILIKNGMSVKTKTRKGQTALHIAAFKGHTELVKLLLAHKADPKAVNRKGESCVEASSTDEIREILEADMKHTQERLERIKASIKKDEGQDQRQNVRKRQAEGGDGSEPVTGPEQGKQPKKRVQVALTHLGDDEEE